VIDQSQAKEVLKIDGPFAVGFDNKKEMFLVYNIDEEKFLKWED
jgi:hypothetical protein